MRSLIASTGNAAVERNVSRSDMDKIHVIMAEMPKLVEIFDNLVRLNSLYDNTDNLTQLNDIYPDIAAIIPKVNAIYPRLSSIEYVEAHIDQLMGLEQTATVVSAYASSVELNANDVLTRTMHMNTQYLDIQTKYGAMVSYMDTVSATAIDIIEREALITTMYDYVLQSSTYINSVLDDIVGVETIATNIHNDKLAISNDVGINTNLKNAVQLMHDTIQDINNSIGVIKAELTQKYNTVVSYTGTVQYNTDLVTSMCNSILNMKTLVCRDMHDVFCMTSSPEDVEYCLCNGTQGYSAKHYMLKAKEYAESTGASVGDFTSHTNRTDNPHGVTKAQLGLSQVVNIAPSDMTVKSATYLENTRTINLTGDVVGSVNFNGKANVSMATTIAMKTINGQSLLGTGNIIISGGSGGSGSNNWYDLINVPTTVSGYGITDVYNKTTVDSLVGAKQNILVSGSTLKTVMGQSLLGAGDITISVPFSSIVCVPTTLSGHGITNAYTKTETNNVISTLLANKVDAVAGKGLSSEDFTYALKTKLENSAAYVHPTSIAVGTFNNVTVDDKGHVTSGSVVTNILDLGITNVYDKTTINSLLADKVNTVIGKGLSTNDFTNDYKLKLDNSNAYVHPTSAVSPGVYTKVTVDNNGHIVSADNPNTLAGYNITDAMSTSHSANVITGLGSSGSSTQVARADHTHPSDNTKVNKTDSIFIGSTSVPLNAISGEVDELVVGINGNASTATKLATPVKINDVDFDGSTDIVIVDTTKQPLDADLTNISSFTSGSYGVLKRLADDTWELDSSMESVSSVSGSGAIEVSDSTNKVISIKPASNLTAGSMSIVDKNKLDTIAENANNYVHPDSPVNAGQYSLVTVDETGHIISATKPTTLTGLGITGVYTSEDVDLILADYQSKLLSGSNVKTINGQSILGSGNLVVTTDISTIPFSNLINTPTTIGGYGITDAYTKTESDTRALQKQDVLSSGVNIKTVNGQSLMGGGNINIASGVTSVAGRTGIVTLTKNDVGLELVTNISDGSRNVLSATKLTTARCINNVLFDGTADINLPIPVNTSDLVNDSGFITNSYHDSTKQDTLVSSTNIKTINGASILGAGNISIAVGAADWGCISGLISNQTDLQTCFAAKQNNLTSGINIKTINGQSIMGNGDLTISTGCVYTPGDNIVIDVAGNICLLNTCNTKWNAKQDTLVSSINVKTINGVSILGTGDICTSSGVSGLIKFQETEYTNAFNSATRNQLILSTASCVTQSIVDFIIKPKAGGSIAILCAESSSNATTRACDSIDFNFANAVAGVPGNDYLSGMSVISGGSQNRNINSYMSVISGGGMNTNCASNHSVISGGICNTITSSACSVINAGNLNTISTSTTSSILSGINNTITTSANSSVISGKYNKILTSECSSIIGGYMSCASTSPMALINGISQCIVGSCFSTILNGQLNTICATTGVMQYNLIAGGCNNKVMCSYDSTILSGTVNSIINSYHSTILGGVYNNIQTQNCRLLFGSCGQIGSNSNVMFALANGTNIITNTVDDFNLIMSVNTDGQLNLTKLKFNDGNEGVGKVLMSNGTGNVCWGALPSNSTVSWGCILGTLSTQLDLQNCFNAKQACLVSGTSIKTINGISLLGSGDISIVAGGGGSSLCCTISSTSTPINLQLFCYNSGSTNTTNLWNCYFSSSGNMYVNNITQSSYAATYAINVCSSSATQSALALTNVQNNGGGSAINTSCVAGISASNWTYLNASSATGTIQNKTYITTNGGNIDILTQAIQASSNDSFATISNILNFIGCSGATALNSVAMTNAYNCLGTYGNVCNSTSLYASGNSIDDKFMCSDLSNTYSSTFMCGLRNSYTVCLGNHTSTTTSLVNCIMFKSVNIGCNIAVNCSIVCNTTYPGQASVTSISIPNLTYSADSTLNSYAFANQMCARSTGTLTASKNIGNILVSTAIVGTNAVKAVNHICSTTASSTTCALVCIEAKTSTSAPAEIHIDSIKVKFPSIPTTDPFIAGMIWNSAGTLKISAG